MVTPYSPPVTGTGFKAGVQRIGGYLAAMVMPNIGAFIAWGLITALFIPTGWLPNETLAQLVGPMITVLLPVLIGYTGGRLVHGQRGAVVGAVATVGIVVGSDIPMFLGAMIIGPLTAFILKRFDALFQDKIKPGFEMLIDNFSAGIIGGGMAIFGLWGIGPVVRTITDAAGDAVDWLVRENLLPFASVLVEPAKVLFLNNAINHGVFGPLGVAQSTETGKSILFMIETNPGSGPRTARGLPAVRSTVAAPHHSSRDRRPFPRRDPRDLLPVRSHEAASHPCHDRWWGLGCADVHRHRRPAWLLRHRRAASSRTWRSHQGEATLE